MKSDEQVIALWRERRMERSPALERAREVTQVVNGEWAVPLPEIDEMTRPAVANLAFIAVEQNAEKIAATLPTVVFPTLGRDDTPGQRSRARTRRDVVLSWWEADALDLRLYELGQWWVAYAGVGVLIRPCPVEGRPRMQFLPATSCYPGPDHNPSTPADVIVAQKQRYSWVKMMFPEAKVMGGVDDEAWVDVLEYVDRDESVLMACANPYAEPSVFSTRLSWTPNLAGVPLFVQAVRQGLDRPISPLEHTIGTYQARSLLGALEYLATKSGVYPDTWLVGRSSNPPRIVTQADGLRGITGIATDGDLKVVNESPGYMAGPVADRYERAERVTARVPAEWGGESQTNVRTGARGDAILSATVDTGIQRAQRAMARMLSEADRAAIAVDKAWFHGQKRTWVSLGGRLDREVVYEPQSLWTSDRHTVSYSAPGTDIQGLTIAIQSRVGSGMMSKQTAMVMDPLIQDAELEHDLVQAEGIEAAVYQAFQQQAASGAIPAIDAARVLQLIRQDVDLAEAIMKADEEARARQATPAEVDEPEAQPGLSMPGMGAEGLPTVPEPEEGQANLASLMRSLRLPMMQTRQEREVGV